MLQIRKNQIRIEFIKPPVVINNLHQVGMLKSQYTLTQTGTCNASGNFTITQGFPQVSQVTSLNQNVSHFPKDIFSGQFKQGKSCPLLNCCSCRATKDLTLTMYGQVISKAYIDSCCNLFPCLISQQLIVTTLSQVLIGKVAKQNCFSKNILIIKDSSDKLKYFIRKRECYCSALLPRMFRCDNQIIYDIIDEKQATIGTIINKIDGCVRACFTYLDNYEINFPQNSTDKQRILLMNALVYLDVVKHEFF